MDKSIVSIIIPAYNVAQYISRGISSCLEQTYKSLEIVIVDDGSTDNIREIIEPYMQIDERIVFVSKENGGVSSARNEALRLATGDFVLFLDGDDWLEKDTVSCLLSLKRKNPQHLIASTLFSVNASSDGTYKKISYASEESVPESIVEKQDAINNFGGRYRLQSACYKLYDMSIIRDYDIRFNEKISYGEDGLFVFDYLKKCCGLVYKDIPLWNILTREGSATSTTYNKKFLTAIDAVELMINREDNTPSIRQAMYRYAIFRTEGLLTIIITNDYKKNYSDICDLQKRLKEYMSKTEEKRLFQYLKYILYTDIPLCIVKCFLVIGGKLKRLLNSKN